MPVCNAEIQSCVLALLHSIDTRARSKTPETSAPLALKTFPDQSGSGKASGEDMLPGSLVFFNAASVSLRLYKPRVRPESAGRIMRRANCHQIAHRSLFLVRILPSTCRVYVLAWWPGSRPQVPYTLAGLAGAEQQILS